MRWARVRLPGPETRRVPGNQVRQGTWVADITGLLDLGGWPAGMRVIVREERPRPGAQLRFTDIDEHRFTAFATDAKKGQLAGWSCGTGGGRGARTASFRNAKDTGLRNLAHSEGLRAEPGLARDRRAGCGLLVWTQMLALSGTARRWEPKRLRLRLFSVAGRLASASGHHITGAKD